MSNSRFKKLKNKNGWFYAILIIIVIVLIGYAFYSAEDKKKIESQTKLTDSKTALEKEKSSVIKRIREIEDQLILLTKSRIQNLIVARVLLILGIILINLGYYHYIVHQSEKHGFMVDHFANCTSFLLFIYSAIAFVSSGTIKVFSKKVHNALFKTVFEEEQLLLEKKEKLFEQLKLIDNKLNNLKST